MVSRMLRLRLVVVPAAVAFALLPSASHGQSRSLTGTVGPGFTITLRDASGARVQHLDPGDYTIVVSDLSPEHNFHLSGPGNVNELTRVEDTGPVTWNVTFRDGIYTYQCDPHSSTMRGRFAVGSAQLPAPGGGGAGAAPTRLSGRVATSRITLTNAAGSRATQVKAGRYRITVRDVSRSENFHLTGPGVNRKTGVRFRGTVTWTLSLKAGRYVYRSDRSKKLRGVVRVTAGAIATHVGHGA